MRTPARLVTARLRAVASRGHHDGGDLRPRQRQRGFHVRSYRFEGEGSGRQRALLHRCPGSFGLRSHLAGRVERGIRCQGDLHLWLYADAKLAHSLVHIAFTAGNRAAVDAFYREGLKARGRDNGPPGARTDYSPTYYAAFLFDPDGNNVEAVCLK